jgi:hypothetical protein
LGTAFHDGAGRALQVSIWSEDLFECGLSTLAMRMNTLALFVATPVAWAAMALGTSDLQDGG